MSMLGEKVRDVFTGYEGHAVARIEHLHGVPELQVACLRDGAIHQEWIDEVRLELVQQAQPVSGFRGGCETGREAVPPASVSPNCATLESVVADLAWLTSPEGYGHALRRDDQAWRTALRAYERARFLAFAAASVLPARPRPELEGQP
jgi:hypothetical protein